MTPQHNAAVTLFFISEGIHDYGYDKWIRAMQDLDFGCIEAAIHLEQWAKEIWNQAYHYQDRDCSFPGVLDYEVSSPFGTWFAQYVDTHKYRLPTDKECKDKIHTLLEEFFREGAGIAHQLQKELDYDA